MIGKKIKLKELFRFLIGGGSAVIIDYTVYCVLLSVHVGTAKSKATSFICGAIVGFIINKLWTFESKKYLKIEIFKYIILYTITAAINALINNVILYLVCIQVIAFLCATGTSTIINFLGQKFFVFRNKEIL